MKTLLLWDIDCTLIDSGGAGERALILALKREFGVDDSLHWLEYFGRTDLWIARTIIQHHFGCATAENIHSFLGAYVNALGDEMHNPRARVLPGIHEMIRLLQPSQGVTHGLLTGNLRQGAEIKLSHLGIWSYFPFGAFADDAEDRNHLGPFALRRAADHLGRNFSGKDVFVIGDTPHDIACGKAIGANTIAVATGRYSAEALAAHSPTAVLTDFNRPEPFLSLLN